ncbi:Uncharacterized protein PBTT_06006 [Plasmodiophora brassicae]
MAGRRPRSLSPAAPVKKPRLDDGVLASTLEGTLNLRRRPADHVPMDVGQGSAAPQARGNANAMLAGMHAEYVRRQESRIRPHLPSAQPAPSARPFNTDQYVIL